MVIDVSWQARKRMMKLIKETVVKKKASGEELGEFLNIIFGEKTDVSKQ